MDIGTLILRPLLTFLLSTAFGIERQRAHKPIGFGTYSLVATGACGLSVVGVDLVHDNPLGVLSAIVTSIGFLGAGALIRTNDKTFGYTTAASIWIFAIFGIVMGVGEYVMAGLIYAAMWIVILIDIYLEKGAIGSYQKKLVVKTSNIVSEKEIRAILNVLTKKYRLMSMDVDKKENKLTFTYQIQGTKEEINKIPNQLYNKEWFEFCRIE